MVTTRLHTIEDLRALGSGAPFELIDGVLIELSPSSIESSAVTARLAALIGHFVIVNELGNMLSSEGGVVLRRNPDTVVAPDVGFISWDRFPDDQELDAFLSVPPDFVVEVISPSNRESEIAKKLSLYQAAGVPLVWIVYPSKKLVNVHALGQSRQSFRAGQTLDGSPVLPGLTIHVDDLFRVQKPTR